MQPMTSMVDHPNYDVLRHMWCAVDLINTRLSALKGDDAILNCIGNDPELLRCLLRQIDFGISNLVQLRLDKM